MIRILVCCGGGFSSSYITEKMKKDIVEYGMDEEVSIEFLPFSLVLEKIDEVDIVVCCPHLNIYVKQLVGKHSLDKPIYILPPRMYGHMDIREIYQDAVDLIALFKQGMPNPVHFEGEENILRVQRICAYKHQKKA